MPFGLAEHRGAGRQGVIHRGGKQGVVTGWPKQTCIYIEWKKVTLQHNKQVEMNGSVKSVISIHNKYQAPIITKPASPIFGTESQVGQLVFLRYSSPNHGNPIVCSRLIAQSREGG